jgi:MFS family permease
MNASSPAEIDMPPTAGLVDQSIKPAYRTYLLVVLTLTALLTYLDRQILGILLPHIKQEFGLKDWQLGILTGPIFAFIYTTATIPIAILADRTNRRNVVAISVLVFSAMTLVCGYAANFWQLCVGRFGVGIGEAGSLPACSSILSDLYPPKQRASALAFYSSGTNVGMLVGFLGGGLIADAYGWRYAFLLAGLPGLLLVLVLFVTVREPARLKYGAVGTFASSSFWTALKFMWTVAAYRWLVSGAALAVWGLAGMLAFTPLFLVQQHGMTTSQVGSILALYCGLFGGVATYIAGVVADRLGKRNLGATLLVPVYAYAITVPFIPILYLTSNPLVAIAAGAIPLALNVTFAGPTYAMSQSLAPIGMRAQSAAILTTACFLIGSSLGPLMIGLTSDLLRQIGESKALASALTLIAFSNAAASYCYWRAYRLLKVEQAGMA